MPTPVNVLGPVLGSWDVFLTTGPSRVIIGFPLRGGGGKVAHRRVSLTCAPNGRGLPSKRFGKRGSLEMSSYLLYCYRSTTGEWSKCQFRQQVFSELRPV